MRKNKFLAALAIAACLATAVPFSASAATVKTDIYKSVTKATDRAALEKIFNAKAYAEKNPDLKTAGITTDAALFNHFLTFGLWEGRECSDTFSVSAYKSGNPDLQKAFVDDILAYYLHYEAFGKTEKRTLITVEACAKAGIAVKNAATGAVISNGAAPAAASTGSSSTTESKVEEAKVDDEAKKAELKDGVKFDAKSGYFYDSTKGDANKVTTALGTLDGFVEVSGKYYRTVDKADAVGIVDKTKYGYSASDKKYYLLESVAGDEARTYKVNEEVYVLVGTKYYKIATEDDAYVTDTTKYVEAYDINNKLRYFELATAANVGYKLEAKDTTYISSKGLYYDRTGIDDKLKQESTKVAMYSDAALKEAYIWAGAATTTAILDAKAVDEATAKDTVNSSYTVVINGKYAMPSQLVTITDSSMTYGYTAAFGYGEDKYVANGNLRNKSDILVVDATKYVQKVDGYHKVVVKVADLADSRKMNTVDKYYELLPAYEEVDGVICLAGGINTNDAAITTLANKVAVAPYIEFNASGDSQDKNKELKGVTALANGIHKEVSATVAGEFDVDNYGKQGSVYYVKTSNGYEKDEVAGYQLKDGYIYAPNANGNYTYHKVVDVKEATAVDKDNFGTTTVNGQTVYYSKVVIDKSVATGNVVVSTDSKYVAVEGKAYPIVAVEDAFKALEGYKVTKNSEDGEYYYTK